jgi:uncharacterized protein DUF4252
MPKAALVCITTMVLAFGANAQDAQTCKIPVNLERLAAKAKEVVDVNMDANTLQLAGKFLNKNDSNEGEARKLTATLRSVCVRSYEFDQSGQYAEEDVEALRAQLRPPTWVRIIGVRSKSDGENVDVYFRWGS